MIFIWAFLPAVFIANAVLQKIGGNKAANVLLLIASILFYAWGEPVYVLLMLLSILVNWMGGMLVGKSSDRDGTAAAGARKIRLTVVIAVNLSLLAYFKYAAMIVKTINRLAGTSFAIPQIALYDRNIVLYLSGAVICDRRLQGGV